MDRKAEQKTRVIFLIVRRKRSFKNKKGTTVSNTSEESIRVRTGKRL